MGRGPKPSPHRDKHLSQSLLGATGSPVLSPSPLEGSLLCHPFNPLSHFPFCLFFAALPPPPWLIEPHQPPSVPHRAACAGLCLRRHFGGDRLQRYKVEAAAGGAAQLCCCHSSAGEPEPSRGAHGREEMGQRYADLHTWGSHSPPFPVNFTGHHQGCPSLQFTDPSTGYKTHPESWGHSLVLSPAAAGQGC